MRICIDVRSPGTTGVLNYSTCLLKSLLKVDRNNEYMVIRDPKRGSWGHDGMEEIVVPSLNPMYWLVWSNTTLPRILDKKKLTSIIPLNM